VHVRKLYNAVFRTRGPCVLYLRKLYKAVFRTK
jgi:hypothetical protein